MNSLLNQHSLKFAFALGVLFCNSLALANRLCSEVLGLATASSSINSLKYRSYSAIDGQIELPPVLQAVIDLSQKKSKPIKLVFFPSNFGSLFEGTPHNLGQTLLREVLGEIKPGVLQKGLAPTEKEIVHYTLDDGKPLSEEIKFETQKGLFRTTSGEVQVLETNRNIIVFAEFFGDYNYVGTYVIGLLKFLNLRGDDLLIVHDDLKTVGVQEQVSPLNAKGNNGIRSILTSMTELISMRLQPEFEAFVSEQKLDIRADLSKVRDQLLASLYSDPEFRYSNSDDFVSRTRNFFQYAFLQIPERSRKSVFSLWIQRYQQIVAAELTTHRLTLGTARSLEEYLRLNTDHEQKDFVLSKAPTDSLLTREERLEARRILQKFIDFDLSQSK